jgi:5-methyltetrahydrofolate--homocysteine methyltransferase
MSDRVNSALLDVLAGRVVVADGVVVTTLRPPAPDGLARPEGRDGTVDVTRPAVARAVPRGCQEPGADAIRRANGASPRSDDREARHANT